MPTTQPWLIITTLPLPGLTPRKRHLRADPHHARAGSGLTETATGAIPDHGSPTAATILQAADLARTPPATALVALGQHVAAVRADLDADGAEAAVDAGGAPVTAEAVVVVVEAGDAVLAAAAFGVGKGGALAVEGGIAC
jgi:hypothetical protein